MLIIPAIDVLDEKVVRLSKGDFSDVKIYNNSVYDQVAEFYSHNFRRIHIVDLGGSRDGKLNLSSTIKKVKSDFNIKLQLGGGVRTEKDIDYLFDIGIDFLIIGSFAVNNITEMRNKITNYGPEKFIIAADVKQKNVFIKGWKEKASITLNELLNLYISEGIKKFLCTDIDLDGMLKGPSVKLYDELMNQFPEIDLIASGGISSLEDLQRLSAIGIESAIIGKAIYENKISLKELETIADKKDYPLS